MTPSRFLSPRELTALSKVLYDQGPALNWHQRLTTVYRSYYTPFAEVLAAIPAGSRLLDLGCGTGALLLLADALGLIEQGVGVDNQELPLSLPRQINCNPNLRFVCAPSVPAELISSCDAVAMVDILHHVPRDQKAPLFAHLAGNAPKGATWIVKDLDPRPAWRACANRVTDFLSTGSRVDYMAMTEVCACLESHGYRIRQAKRLDKHVWSHFLVVADNRL